MFDEICFFTKNLRIHFKYNVTEVYKKNKIFDCDYYIVSISESNNDIF